MVLLVSLRCSAQHILGAAETHRDRGLVFPLLEDRGRWWLPAQGGGWPGGDVGDHLWCLHTESMHSPGG